ncbi:MAG: copper resistance protein CopC, partial [Actinobacteria bacterium]|nr:copper resistance protein CopC [Actinomycetota bacterium]
MRRPGILSALMVVAGVLLTPAAAWAHAELISSDPGYGERLGRAPAAMRLEFSGAMDLTGARLTLQRTGDVPESLHATLASPDRRVVSVPLPAHLDDGPYSMVWFFLGNDGHLLGGEVPFQVGEPTAAAAEKGAVPAAEPKAAVRSLGPGIAGPAIAVESAPAGAVAAPKRAPFTIAVATPQAVVRFLDYTSLAVLIGGGFFLTRVWAEGTREWRTQQLLWWGLVGSALATLLTFGLTAAGLRGVGALDALHPSVMGTLSGTRFARVMTARAAFLALGCIVLTTL